MIDGDCSYNKIINDSSKLERMFNVTPILKKLEGDGKQVLGYSINGENIYIQWENEQDLYLSHIIFSDNEFRIVSTNRWSLVDEMLETDEF
jgi:hypothetical protein